MQNIYIICIKQPLCSKLALTIYISSAQISSMKPTSHMTAAATFLENPATAGAHTLITPHDRSETHVSTQRDVPGGLSNYSHSAWLYLIHNREKGAEQQNSLSCFTFWPLTRQKPQSVLYVITWTHDNVSSYSKLTGHHRGRHAPFLFSLLST